MPLCSVGASFLSKGCLRQGVGVVARVERSGCIKLLLAGIVAGTVETESGLRLIVTLIYWGSCLPLKRENGAIKDG